MGYTHYWYRKKEISTSKMEEIVKDVRIVVDYCQNDLGIILANGYAEAGSKPELSIEEGINFNGSDEQPIGVWTTSEQIFHPWPSPTAGLTEETSDPLAKKTNGSWFAGDLVEQRVAPIDNKTGFGSGSYETFSLERILPERGKNDENELIFDCCKTAFRPYDLVVTACLIIAKKHLGNKIIIKSDGEDKDWIDAKILCNNLLGYGMDFYYNGDKGFEFRK